jgi:hypothetical protein
MVRLLVWKPLENKPDVSPATIAPPVYHVFKELPKRGVTSVS